MALSSIGSVKAKVGETKLIKFVKEKTIYGCFHIQIDGNDVSTDYEINLIRYAKRGVIN